jgi:predicted nuclease of restriction endonuclease-like (RecB) superfamily
MNEQELKTRTKMKNAVIAGSDYDQFLSALKTRIQTARLSAARAVNRDLILLYWDIGRAIVEKQELLNWGDSVVEMVAKDLQKAFPEVRGFSADSIWRMRQFFAEYSNSAFLEQAVPEMKKSRGGVLAQAVPELARGSNSTKHDQFLSQSVREVLAAVPWGHHVELLKKVKAPAARVYYLRATARYGWTRNVLLNQIKAGAYERAVTEKKTHNFPLALPEYLAEQAEEALKSSYNLEFLGIRREIKERQLEDRLLERLREFILELGYGFCFVGRQHRLVLGQKEYFIDLLFYHRFIKALVAFELKIGPFEPEYAGKMDFYLNLLNEKERAPDDHPSIGIILCAEKDNLEVEFALKSKTNPIGVAEYHLQPKLPPELKGKLPTARQLTEAVRSLLPTEK